MLLLLGLVRRSGEEDLDGGSEVCADLGELGLDGVDDGLLGLGWNGEGICRSDEGDGGIWVEMIGGYW